MSGTASLGVFTILVSGSITVVAIVAAVLVGLLVRDWKNGELW